MIDKIRKLFLTHFNLHKGGFIILVSFLFLGITTPTHFADAVVHSKISEVLNFLIGIPFLVFLGPLKVLLILAGPLLSVIPIFLSSVLLKWVTSDYFIALKYTSGGIVDIGWDITRDIANLAFVVILIIIALNTIRGDQRAGANLLLKLIFIALIINFSKVIAGVVVDFANIIMGYFLSLSTELYREFINFAIKNSALDIIVNFSPSKIWPLIQETLSLKGTINSIMETVGTIVMSIMISVTLLIISAIFVVRYIAIWILVITMPLALAASILPQTASFAKKWWDEFLCWAFVGIAPAFVLFLTSVLVSKALNNELFEKDHADEISKSIDGAGGAAFEFFVEPLLNIMTEMMLWFVIIIFIWIALQKAMKTTCEGASGINKLAVSGFGKLKGFGINVLKGMGKDLRTKGPGRMGAAGRWAGRMPGARSGVGMAGKAAGVVGGRVMKRPREWTRRWMEKRTKNSFDKDPSKWLPDLINRRELDINGNAVDTNTTWAELTRDQRKKLTEKTMATISQRVAQSLGKGKGFAKKIASVPWDSLTPETQKAIITVITAEKLLKAQADQVNKKIISFQQFSQTELERTIKRASDQSDILAAKILLAQKINADKNDPNAFNGHYFFDTDKKRAQLLKDAQRVGLGSNVLAYQPQIIDELYKGTDMDSIQRKARAMRDATAKAAQSINEMYRDMESMLDNQLKALAESGNAHQRIAALRRLADNHTFDQQFSESDQKNLIDLSRQFGQEHNILKRYLHLSRDNNELDDVMGKMTGQDWQKVHKNIFEDRYNTFFERMYGQMSAGSVGQTLQSKDLWEGWKKKTDNAETRFNAGDTGAHDFLVNNNQAVHKYMDKNRNRPNGVDNWPRSGAQPPTGGGTTQTPPPQPPPQPNTPQPLPLGGAGGTGQAQPSQPPPQSNTQTPPTGGASGTTQTQSSQPPPQSTAQTFDPGHYSNTAHDLWMRLNNQANQDITTVDDATRIERLKQLEEQAKRQGINDTSGNVDTWLSTLNALNP
jgi:hypothetical protein